MHSYPASPSPSSPFDDEGVSEGDEGAYAGDAGDEGGDAGDEAGDAGDAGDESVCEGDGVQVSGSSGKIDHLLMDAHPSISAGISVIPDLLDV